MIIMKHACRLPHAGVIYPEFIPRCWTDIVFSGLREQGLRCDVQDRSYPAVVFSVLLLGCLTPPFPDGNECSDAEGDPKEEERRRFWYYSGKSSTQVRTCHAPWRCHLPRLIKYLRWTW